MAASPDAGTIINLARYPIDQPDHPAFEACLPPFARNWVTMAVRPEGVRAARVSGRPEAEAERTAPFAHRNFNRTNAYFGRETKACRPIIPNGGFTSGPTPLCGR